MAPLRSSRSTRNQEHNIAPRNRAGVIDWDPTEGLPVHRWQQVTVRINQDASADLNDGNNHATATHDPDFPWPEQELPSFFPQLAPHSQELLRRARMGATNAKPSVWDRKTESWISSSEADARTSRLKSKHLLHVDADSPTANEEDDDNDDNESLDEDGILPKKRKLAGGIEDRTFEAKKWVQIPVTVAEKMPEPKYLADRRPGMASLYGAAYKNTNGFGIIGLSTTGPTTVSGFDLGEGSGLGNAAGVLGSGSAQGTPARKNMPPKRKKKKLGGPGRKKAVPVGDSAAGTGEGDTTAAEGAAAAVPEAGKGHAAEKAGEEISGSESEEEGSEDGEIDEGKEAEAEGEREHEGAGDAEGKPEAEGEPDNEGKPVPEGEPDSESKPVPEGEPDSESKSDAVGNPEAEAEGEIGQSVPAVEETAEIAPENAEEPQEAEKPEKASDPDETDLLGGLEAAVEGMEQSAE